MALTFEEQNIIDHGVGDYHINHFIGYFDGSALDHYQLSPDMVIPLNAEMAGRIGVARNKLPSPQAINTDDLNSHLQRMLPSIFNPNSTAVVHRTSSRFRQRPTVRFQATAFSISTGIGGATVSLPHEDWVALTEDSSHPHLNATTLKRVQRNAEDYFVEYSPLIPVLSSPLTGVAGWIAGAGLYAVVPDDNSRHFLAGRRTWRCGFDEALNLHYFETAAFERFSDNAYVRLESGLRPMVNNCWVETIVNFSRLIGSTLMTPSTPPSGYQNMSIGGDPTNNIPPFGPVYFRNGTFSAADKNAAKSHYDNISWFAPMVSRMPSLSSTQMPGF